MVVQSLSCVQFIVASWTVVRQAPLPMEFSRQEYWNGLLFPSPEDLPDPEMETATPALAGRFFTTGPLRKPTMEYNAAIKTNEDLSMYI